MSEKTLHRMTLTSAAGENPEEWRCPVCGRWLVVDWQPYSRIVIRAGDGEALHYGGTGVTLTEKRRQRK